MTDKEIIKGILKGDEACFKTFVEQYQSIVLNTCYRFVNNRFDAEDLTQEVFIEAYRSINKFKFNSKLSTWLYRIAVNKSLNFIRDNKKRRIFTQIENFLFNISEESSEEISIEEERKIVLHNTINNLSKNQKTAFTLHKLNKLSYKEIAEIMGLSLSAVESLIYRANQNIRKKLLNHYKKNDDKHKF